MQNCFLIQRSRDRTQKLVWKSQSINSACLEGGVERWPALQPVMFLFTHGLWEAAALGFVVALVTGFL